MTSKLRSLFLSSTIIAVLLFSAVGTTAVYADDGTTADTPTAEAGSGEDASEEATKDGNATEIPATDTVEATATPEPSATGEPVVPVDDAAPSDPKPAEPAVEEAAPAADTSILEQVPENTTVSVLDANGQPQPLATQGSADAIEVTSDPIWCPATQTTPTPGANGCTASFTSFDLLLTELAGNPAYQQAGTIYIQQNAYAGGESTIDFNAYDLSNIQNFDLTVTGGWNTTTNVVDPANSSTFTAPIVIGSSTNPWGGSLTINNISIFGTNGTGLTVYSQNDITLSNVQVSNSVTGAGAELDAGGDVTVSDSNFERNRTAGAIIRAGGNVAVANTSFSNSGTARLQIDGVDITSGGSVSLFDVLANGNREVGANIVADGRVSIGSSFIGGSSFSGTTGLTNTTCPGQVGAFCGYGLQVVTPDSIDLQGVIANENFLWGAWLNAGQNVNIVDSIFNANSTNSPAFIDDTGLLVNSGGTVSLNNVEANGNRLIGAVIDAVGDVSVNNSKFSNNNGETISGGGVTTFHGYGLQVTSDGSIFLNGVTASGNTLFGAQLDAAGDVAVANSFFDNNTTGSLTDALGYGLGITSGQSVFIDTVSLSGNQLYGANIQATGDAFLDFITATNNGTNGVEVNATCTFLNGGTFTGNGEYGLFLTNSALNQLSPPVFGGNGLGDISPAAPGACPVAAGGGNPGGGNTGGGSTGGGTIGSGTTGNTTSGQSQLVSLSTIAGASGKGLGLMNGTMSLNGLFTSTNHLFTVSTAKSGNVTTIGIFTGKYAYIHSANGLHIILLQPVSYTGAWMGAGS